MKPILLLLAAGAAFAFQGSLAEPAAEGGGVAVQADAVYAIACATALDNPCQFRCYDATDVIIISLTPASASCWSDTGRGFCTSAGNPGDAVCTYTG